MIYWTLSKVSKNIHNICLLSNWLRYWKYWNEVALILAGRSKRTRKERAAQLRQPTGRSQRWSELGPERPRPAPAGSTPASCPSPTGPALRANPFPEVTDLICRLPLPTLFYRKRLFTLETCCGYGYGPTRKSKGLPSDGGGGGGWGVGMGLGWGGWMGMGGDGGGSASGRDGGGGGWGVDGGWEWGGSRSENRWGCAGGHWKLDPKRSRPKGNLGPKRSNSVRIGSFSTPKDRFCVGEWEKVPQKIMFKPKNVKKQGQNGGTSIWPNIEGVPSLGPSLSWASMICCETTDSALFFIDVISIPIHVHSCEERHKVAGSAGVQCVVKLCVIYL